MSAVNLHEVVVKLVDLGSPPDQIVGIVSQLDVEVVPFDRKQVIAAGLLRAQTRGAGLSLADRACLALAMSRKAIALMTDRASADLAVDVTVELAR